MSTRDAIGLIALTWGLFTLGAMWFEYDRCPMKSSADASVVWNVVIYGLFNGLLATVALWGFWIVCGIVFAVAGGPDKSS